MFNALPPRVSFTMALQAAYQQFLGAPNSANLTADASLYYITTSTIVHGSTEIIKHFGTLRKQLKKNKEAVLSAVESANGLALEIDTALEFITNGGPYLPRLDDNFLSDRKVYLPVVCNKTIHKKNPAVTRPPPSSFPSIRPPASLILLRDAFEKANRRIYCLFL